MWIDPIDVNIDTCRCFLSTNTSEVIQQGAYLQRLQPQWEVEGRMGRVEGVPHCTPGHLGFSGSEQVP